MSPWRRVRWRGPWCSELQEERMQMVPLKVSLFLLCAALKFFSVFPQLRVSKEQDHFLISPKGVSCSEVTASSLVSVVQHQYPSDPGGTGHLYIRAYCSVPCGLTLVLGKDAWTQWVPGVRCSQGAGNKYSGREEGLGSDLESRVDCGLGVTCHKEG